MKNEHLMELHPGVFYYTVDDKWSRQQPSLLHQVQGMQLGKTYDLSAYVGMECNINQVRNDDGSITATITHPNSLVKTVIRTDTTGKVPVQINYVTTYDDKIIASKAIDDNGIATAVSQEEAYGFEGPYTRTLKGIETTEPGGTRPFSSVLFDPSDGSVKILARGELGQSSVGRHEIQDDNDGDPTVATLKNGMKATFASFNAMYPTPEASKDDSQSTMYSDYSVFRITNADSSVKTHMIINPDGSVQPGPKWTSGAPVEPANVPGEPADEPVEPGDE
jgi:hypothetical protein